MWTPPAWWAPASGATNVGRDGLRGREPPRTAVDQPQGQGLVALARRRGRGGALGGHVGQSVARSSGERAEEAFRAAELHDPVEGVLALGEGVEDVEDDVLGGDTLGSSVA